MYLQRRVSRKGRFSLWPIVTVCQNIMCRKCRVKRLLVMLLLGLTSLLSSLYILEHSDGTKRYVNSLLDRPNTALLKGPVPNGANASRDAKRIHGVPFTLPPHGGGNQTGGRASGRGEEQSARGHRAENHGDVARLPAGITHDNETLSAASDAAKERVLLDGATNRTNNSGGEPTPVESNADDRRNNVTKGQQPGKEPVRGEKKQERNGASTMDRKPPSAGKDAEKPALNGGRPSGVDNKSKPSETKVKDVKSWSHLPAQGGKTKSQSSNGKSLLKDKMEAAQKMWRKLAASTALGNQTKVGIRPGKATNEQKPAPQPGRWAGNKASNGQWTEGGKKDSNVRKGAQPLPPVPAQGKGNMPQVPAQGKDNKGNAGKVGGDKKPGLEKEKAQPLPGNRNEAGRGELASGLSNQKQKPANSQAGRGGDPMVKHRFDFVLNEPAACKDSEGGGRAVFLLLLVATTHEARAVRQGIRDTWAGPKELMGKPIVSLFLLGTSPNATLNELTRRESDQHHDIIMEDFIDSYRNLSLKTMMAMKWMAHYCPQASYVLKTDHDMYIGLANLVFLLSSPETPDSRFVTGHVFQAMPPIRDSTRKNYMPLKIFKDTKYPPYCAGAAYVMSGDVPPLVFNMAGRLAKFIHIEDVLVGICLGALGIKPVHNSAFRHNSMPFVPYSYCAYRNVTAMHGVTRGNMLAIWKEEHADHDSHNCG